MDVEAESIAALQLVRGQILPAVSDLPEVRKGRGADPLDGNPAILRAEPERRFVFEPEVTQAAHRILAADVRIEVERDAVAGGAVRRADPGTARHDMLAISG